MTTNLLDQTESLFRVALELPLRSPQRHWMVGAARRQLDALARLERRRQMLRLVRRLEAAGRTATQSGR